LLETKSLDNFGLYTLLIAVAWVAVKHTQNFFSINFSKFFGSSNMSLSFVNKDQEFSSGLKSQPTWYSTYLSIKPSATDPQSQLCRAPSDAY
jgi:hypothetical protein